MKKILRNMPTTKVIVGEVSLQSSRIHMSWYGILVFFCLLFLWVTPTYAVTSAGTTNTNLVTNGLIGHWTFDGKHMTSATATDSSGSGNNGRLVGMSASSRVIGKIGQSLNFSGTSNYISFGTGKYIFSKTTAFSGSAWIKTSTSTAQLIMNNWAPVSTGGWYFTVLSTQPGRISFSINDLFGTGRVVYGSTRVDDGKWHHVVFTYDGSNTAAGIKLYVDGRAENLTTVQDSDPGTLSDGGFTIGCLSSEFTSCVRGSLDDVRMYSRVLSLTEIQALYKAGGGVITAVTPGKTTTTGGGGVGPNSGLVGHWTFDGKNMTNATATDSSGSGNNGTLTNMAASTSKTVGKIGQALTFDGADDYIATGYTNQDSSITLSAWIYPESLGEGNLGRILDKRENGGTETVYFAVNGPARIIFGRLHTILGGAWYTNSDSIGFNRWQHVAVTYNDSLGSNDPVMYINGVRQEITEVQPPVGTPRTNSDRYMIGNRGDTTRTFDGKIDDVRIYNRILSAKEIQSLYQAGDGAVTTVNSVNNNRTSMNSGLVGHWTFDGKHMTNTSALDISGNGRTGTLTNMTGSTSKAIGKIGQGLRLDGVNDLVNIPYNGIDFEYTQPITISAWVKLNDVTPPGGMQTIFGRLFGAGPGTGTFVSWCRTAVMGVCNANSFAFYLANDYTNDGVIVSTATNSARPNVWTHITATYDGSGEAGGVSLYINGVLKTPTIHVDNLSGSITGTEDWMIGDDGTSDSASGIVDDVRLYNRELTANEVRVLYKFGSQ